MHLLPTHANLATELRNLQTWETYMAEQIARGFLAQKSAVHLLWHLGAISESRTFCPGAPPLSFCVSGTIKTEKMVK